MILLTCPRCGADLVEDEWEDLQETNDGGIILGGYPAYVCLEHCGYVKRLEPVPEIIAQQDDDRLLLSYPDGLGRILDVHNQVIWPPMVIDSLLARGYWEEYTGNHDVEGLLANVRDSRASFLETPNLFQFATSELSQDAFLCYLMSWSGKLYRSLDQPMHEAAVDFVSVIFNGHGLPVPTIESISIECQFKSLDILAIVNDTYAILIEDKTYTEDHSNQLARYREMVKVEYPNLIQLPIYYKIVDQSHYRSVIQAGYVPVKREMMLKIMDNGIAKGINNTIFIDYYRHLQKLEDRFTAFRVKRVSEWDSYAWQGFYQEIQKKIDGDWGYVSNQSGGFWAFWWKSAISERYFMQLEQSKLCVKVEAEEGEDKRDLRKTAIEEVLNESGKRDLNLKKPARLGNGKTMTIALRPDYIQTTFDGMADITRTIEELMKY